MKTIVLFLCLVYVFVFYLLDPVPPAAAAAAFPDAASLSPEDTDSDGFVVLTAEMLDAT